MLDNIFGFFEKLVMNFTWTRLTFLISVLLLVVTGVATFEFYTNHFRLNKLEREAKVLEQLIEVAKKVEAIPETELSRATFERMLRQLDQELGQPPSLTTGSFPEVAPKAIYAVLPWVILALLIVVTTSSGRTYALAGLAVIAIPLVILGANLPTFQEEWINNYAYPWGSMLLVIFGILYAQRRRTS